MLVPKICTEIADIDRWKVGQREKCKNTGTVWSKSPFRVNEAVAGAK